MNSELSTRFWQINLGHVITVCVVLMGLAVGYGQFGDKIETLQATVLSLQQEANLNQIAISELQVARARDEQDRIDLHKTVDDDFARRLSKLEEKTH